ncbi:MAG: histidinol-phosphate transaminase [Micrococcales bacterium]|nr:MAG: histidinol-phosphate transaminase [Micrococcales bacterium]
MTTLDQLPLRPDLRGRTPYGAPQLDVPVRLNTNENPYQVPAEVTRAMADAVADVLPQLNRYPDRDHTRLRDALAGYLGHQLDRSQVWAANGSNEILQQLLQAFGGPDRVALGFTPAYSMHPIIAAGTGTSWVDGTREGNFDLSAELVAEQIRVIDPDVVFICSPNNPTGTSVGLDVVDAAYSACRGIVIVDEAYAEFARAGTPSALTLLPGRPRLVVSRTMSKAFALAGARVGYLAGDPGIVDAVQLVRLPYHLSAPTQAIALAALAHTHTMLGTVEALKRQRDRIVQLLPTFGLTPLPSDANFVLFGGLDDESATWQALVDRGVLVRDVGIAGHLRVSAGTEAEVSTFLAQLPEALAAPVESRST